MRPNSVQRSAFSVQRTGFTLVELLLVMMIIVILSGVIVGSVGYVNRKGAEAKTQALFAKMSGSLEEYEADWGAYPLATQTWAYSEAQSNYNRTLMSNLAGLGGGKRYIEWEPGETNQAVMGGSVAVYIVDGFGTPICYFPATNDDNTANRGAFPDGRVNFSSYDLWSFGADLKSTNATTAADDIKNW